MSKLVADIDERFTSGNGVAVERVTIRAAEWNLLREKITKLENEILIHRQQRTDEQLAIVDGAVELMGCVRISDNSDAR